VLIKYLRLNAHDKLGLMSEEELRRERITWTVFASRYPGSLHAWAGLGLVEAYSANLSNDRAQLRSAADAYLQGTRIALAYGRLAYTRELSDVLGKLRDVTLTDSVFNELSSGANTPAARYEVMLSYAIALNANDDSRAGQTFAAAMDVYPSDTDPSVKIEAINRYAQYLLARNKPGEAFGLLNAWLTASQRLEYTLPPVLRLQAMQQLGLDTTDAEKEVSMSHERFVGASGGTVEYIADQGEGAQITPNVVHTNITDDCRANQYAAVP
jgi:hypothetical protein